MNTILPSISGINVAASTRSPGVLPSSARRAPFPDYLPLKLKLVLDQAGKPFSVCHDKPSLYALPVGSKALNSVIRDEGLSNGISLNKQKLSDINDFLFASAEKSNLVKDVWKRVAKIDGGIEIDLGDPEHTRVRVLPDLVDIVPNGSDTLFYRHQYSRSMVLPAEIGDLDKLKKYVNLDPVSFLLFKAWLSYTLAHPKVPTSKYVILAVLGGQGSGKSFFTKLIQNLLDPSAVDVQSLPSSVKELAVAAQHSHVLCYDNLRTLTPAISDALCMMATGAAISGRQLYTDGDQHVMPLHSALVLNGIHAFITQPDLAQRCLPLYLKPFPAKARKSEVDLQRELAQDMPVIMRGLLDLIAAVFAKLPSSEVTSEERMLDFCKWLAAMELVNDAPKGVYQAAYSDALNQGQRDALLDSSLGSAMLDFGESLKAEWCDTPKQLLEALCFHSDRSPQRSAHWPDNPIALSKRLQGLQAALSTQGVLVDFGRGKERTISVRNGACK